MKDIIEEKVYYADTDTYGVVWHGTYLRWMEKARVEWCAKRGYSLTLLEENDILLPVTNINIKYKMSARLEDEILIETSVEKFNGLTAAFRQKIILKNSGKVCTDAFVEICAVTKEAKLHRRMPEILAQCFKKELGHNG